MKSFSQFLLEKKDPPTYKELMDQQKNAEALKKLDSEKVTKCLQGADPSKQLQGQSSDIKTRRPVSKKLSGDGKIVIKPKRGEAVKSKNIVKQKEQSVSQQKDITKPKKGEIAKARKLVKQQRPGTNTTITPSKSGDVIKTYKNKVTTNLSNVKDPITSIEQGPRRTITKPPVTTNVSKPVKFKSFLDRMGKATGIESPIAKKLSQNTKVTGLSTKDANKLVTKARVGGLLKGAGRFAGGVFAAKDAYDKARIEKAKGRSKTSQILGGIARGAGGYLGAAAGATLGTIAGGGVGSAVLGTGGAIAGYNVGTKVGDYLYKKGRELATGKKGEAAKVKFKDFMKKIRK